MRRFAGMHRQHKARGTCTFLNIVVTHYTQMFQQINSWCADHLQTVCCNYSKVTVHAMLVSYINQSLCFWMIYVTLQPSTKPKWKILHNMKYCLGKYLSIPAWRMLETIMGNSSAQCLSSEDETGLQTKFKFSFECSQTLGSGAYSVLRRTREMYQSAIISS